MSTNGAAVVHQDETAKVLQANATYAHNFTDELKKLAMPPGRKLAIVTCMDAVHTTHHTHPHLPTPAPHIHPQPHPFPSFPPSPSLPPPPQRLETGRLAGLKEGDAHVIRNAGGRVHEALRSLAISQQLLGTQEVLIIHHTDCGMLTFTDQQLRDKLKAQSIDADHVSFLSFKDLEQSVKDDLQVYRHSNLVRQDVPVRGFIYDVHTGKLDEVKA